MADVVRILGLDDDNHALMFRMETGEIYGSPRKLIEFLSHAHDVEYQVKVFSIVGSWSDFLEAYDDEDVDQMFYYLEGVYDQLPARLNDFDLVFDLFWDSANIRVW